MGRRQVNGSGAKELTVRAEQSLAAGHVFLQPGNVREEQLSDAAIALLKMFLRVSYPPRSRDVHALPGSFAWGLAMKVA